LLGNEEVVKKIPRSRTLKMMHDAGLIEAGKGVISFEIQGETAIADLDEAGSIVYEVRGHSTAAVSSVHLPVVPAHDTGTFTEDPIDPD